jgi:hypothetical protein
MSTPPNNPTPGDAPAAAAEDQPLFAGDGPRGDDRPAPLDACGDQGINVSAAKLSALGPVLASIFAVPAATPDHCQ